MKANGLESEITVQNNISLHFNANKASDLWRIIETLFGTKWPVKSQFTTLKRKKKEPSFRSLGVILPADKQADKQADRRRLSLSLLPLVKVVTTRTGWATAAPSLL